MPKIPVKPVLEGYVSGLKTTAAKSVETAAKKTTKPKKARPFYPTPSGKKPAFVDPRKPKPKARPVKPRTRPLSVKEAMNRDFEVFKPAKPAGVSPQRVEKTAANIRKAYPNLPEAEVMKRANMTKSERSAYLSEQHSADSAERAASKASARTERQEANRAAWHEKNRAKMNRFKSYKASNPTPVKKAAKKARSKKGAK